MNHAADRGLDGWTYRAKPTPPPDASPIIPHADALPTVEGHVSMLFFGRPRLSYGYSSLNAQHTLRLDAKGRTVTIAISDPYQAYQLLVDLELAASALRRRLDLPADAPPSPR